MCTLIVAFQAFSNTPLLVAANRDENLDRPALPPAHRKIDDVSLFAPQDIVAGGTWIGINAHGVFAGLTNRASQPSDPTLPSRGRWVPHALRHQTAAEARAAFEGHDGTRENGFHLVVADRTSAFLVVSDPQMTRVEDLHPGIHIVTEQSFIGDASPARARTVMSRLSFDPKTPAPSEDFFRNVLSVRAPHAPDGTLVHIPEVRYGTRASTLIRFESDHIDFLHAEGPPDTTSYVDLSSAAQKMAAADQPR